MPKMCFFRDRRRIGPPFLKPSGSVSSDGDPGLIRDAHLFLLDRLGRSMGLAFYPQPALEPPTDERIVVFGRFDPRARQREFGLQIGDERLIDGRQGRVAWLIDLYIPVDHRRQGFGTQLMSGLLDLWGRAGVAEARLTSTAEGLAAYEAWGFVADNHRDRPGGGLEPLRFQLG